MLSLENVDRNITEIREKYGLDWSKLIIDGVSLEGEDIRDIILPIDKNFFQKIRNKSLLGTKLPSCDYSSYNFENVNLWNCEFAIKSKLPNDREFFQRIKKRALIGCRLPNMDYSKYNFKDVVLCRTIFPRKAMLPKDKFFFQKIYEKNVHGCILPVTNYSDYIFDDVTMTKCTVPAGSILPTDKRLFQKVKNKDVRCSKFPHGDYSQYDLQDVYLDESSLLLDICKNILIYNLNDACCWDFSKKKYQGLMSLAESDVIRFKYPEKIISKNIILPNTFRDSVSKTEKI